MPPEEKKKEETKAQKAETVAGAVIPALGGLAGVLGSAVPSLRKPKQNVTGSQAAIAAGSRLAGQIHGAGQQGFGATRALRGNEARRVAETATREAAGTAGRIGIEEARLQDARLDQRNQRLAQTGKDIGDFIGQTTAGVVEAKAAQAAQGGAQPAPGIPGQAEVAGVDPITGVPTGPQPFIPEIADAGTQQAQELQAPGQLQVPEAQEPGIEGGFDLQAPPVSALDAYRRSLGLPPQPMMNLAPQFELQLRLTNLAYDEAQRRGTMSPGVLANLNRFLQMDPIAGTPLDTLGVDPGGLIGEQ